MGRNGTKQRETLPRGRQAADKAHVTATAPTEGPKDVWRRKGQAATWGGIPARDLEI